MRKTILPLVLIALTLSACNIPVPTSPEEIPASDKAATIVAQTLTAAASSGQELLASPTLEEPPTYGQPVFPSPTAGEAPTLQPNATPTGETGTPSATTLTVDSNTNCREGPGTTYNAVIVLTPRTHLPDHRPLGG